MSPSPSSSLYHAPLFLYLPRVPAQLVNCSMTVIFPISIDIRRYSFTIINTGQGINYHPSGQYNMDNTPKDMIRAGFTLKRMRTQIFRSYSKFVNSFVFVVSCFNLQMCMVIAFSIPPCFSFCSSPCYLLTKRMVQGRCTRLSWCTWRVFPL